LTAPFFHNFRFSHFPFRPYRADINSTLPQQNPGFVRQTFSSIAKRYDLANHVLSGGVDFLWRARAARIVADTHPRRILDLATGSGDLAKTLRAACPNAQVVGADFCLPMLEVARQKQVPSLVQADGLNLPFREGVFDALTVAFGLRNMASWDAALREMNRVLRPGGLVLVMDFSLPEFAPFRGVYRAYLHHGLPRLAGLVTGHREAYEYLGESIESFPRGKGMLDLIAGCGFEKARRRLLFNGVASIYTAVKTGGN
jgi:demethylmenaquinone methyltransferase/2-methoxy-6-polyprenyl-1,4-benzoquinol methylase